MLRDHEGPPDHVLLSRSSHIGKTLSYRKRQMIYAAGDRSDSFFLIKQGGVKLTIVSEDGKEAVTGILDRGEFFGPEALDVAPLPRATSAVALCAMQAVKVERDAVLELMYSN